MGSRMIGIEIGSDTLKLAVVKNGVVKQMVAQTMPDNLVREGVPTSGPALTAFIKGMMKQYKIRRGDCALVLPPQKVVALQVSMPVMNEQKLKLNLPFEFRDYIGSDADQYEYDYIVLNVRDQMMDLYVAACKKDLVETYYGIFKKAGLTLKAAMPAEMAWLNLVAKQKNLPEQIAVADMGYHRTRVNIFAKGDFIMGKDIDMAGQMLDETIAGVQMIDPVLARVRKEDNVDHIQTADFMNEPYTMIGVEIMRTINFYNFSRPNEGEPLQHLYYCGGSANIEDLRDTITRATGLTLHHIGRLLGLDDNDEREPLALVCAQAAGAAMQLK